MSADKAAKPTEPTPEKAAKKTHIEKREVKRKFWFSITDKEKGEMVKLSLELDRQVDVDRGQLLADIEKFNADKKARNAEINEKERNRKEVNHHIRVSKELREVDAIEVRDYGKKQVRYVVGKAVMEEREMNSDELQTSLNLERREKERKEDKQATAQSATQSRAERALRAEAEAFHKQKAGGKKPVSEVQEVIRQETSKHTKRSSVDETPAVAAPAL